MAPHDPEHADSRPGAKPGADSRDDGGVHVLESASARAAAEGCPDDVAWEQFVAGGAGSPAGQQTGLILHLNRCDACRAKVEALREDAALLGELAKAHATQSQHSNYADSSRGSAGARRVITVRPEIPGYRILSELHRGGQGVVYRAIQVATRRTVALKVLLQGAFASVRQLRRFEREIDLVAGLRHPNIVTIHDSGAAPDGCRFFAMEYIEGSSLGAHRQITAATTRSGEPDRIHETLSLFCKICDGVHYAHQRGVIHRDLKPGNIRVDSAGEPHILDFGLAKAIVPDEALSASGDPASARAMTLSGEFMGTLAYASPEQTRGDASQVDVRTDVYALGVILYELLTNNLPYPVVGPMADVLRVIAEQAPAPPSSWYRRAAVEPQLGESVLPLRVDGEVETIVLKALAKDKERRYQSADELRRDLERYLAGEPIDAKRDSKWYVFQKQVRRHKWRVSVGAAFAAVIVVGAAMVLRSRQAYADERDLALNMISDLKSQIQFSDPYHGSGSNIHAPEMFDEYSRRLDANPPQHPEFEAAIRDTLGHAYKEYWAFEPAERELTRALAARRKFLTPPDVKLAETINNLGDVKVRTGRFDEAEQLYTESIAMRRQLFPGDCGELAESLNDMASLFQQRGKYHEAEPMFREALSMRERLHDTGRLPEAHELAASLNNLACCLCDMARYEESEKLYRQALDVQRSLGLEDDPKGAFVMSGLGRCLTHLKELDEAETLLRHSLDIKQRRMGAQNQSVATTLDDLAELGLARGELAVAEAYVRQSLAIRRPVNHDGSPAGATDFRTAGSLVLLGKIQLAGGDVSNAESSFREAVELLKKSPGEHHPDTGEAMGYWGECLMRQGHFGTAAPLIKDGYACLVQTVGTNHPVTRVAFDRLDTLHAAERAAAAHPDSVSAP